MSSLVGIQYSSPSISHTLIKVDMCVCLPVCASILTQALCNSPQTNHFAFYFPGTFSGPPAVRLLWKAQGKGPQRSCSAAHRLLLETMKQGHWWHNEPLSSICRVEFNITNEISHTWASFVSYSTFNVSVFEFLKWLCWFRKTVIPTQRQQTQIFHPYAWTNITFTHREAAHRNKQFSSGGKWVVCECRDSSCESEIVPYLSQITTVAAIVSQEPEHYSPSEEQLQDASVAHVTTTDYSPQLHLSAYWTTDLGHEPKAWDFH